MAESSWPASPEDAEAFLRGVRERLVPETDKVFASLPQQYFWELCAAIFAQIADTPALKDHVSKYVPPETPHEVERLLENLAGKDPSMTLKRAVSKGLVLRIAPMMADRLLAEYDAWEKAVICGRCAAFNESQTRSGYEQAMRSVDEARLRIALKHPDNWMAWRIKQRMGVKLQSALLVYWLPLSLWALSVPDAIEALRRLSQPAQLKRLGTSVVEKLYHDKPDLLLAFRGETLTKLRPTSSKDRDRFIKAAKRLRLFRPAKPELRFVWSPETPPQPLIEFPDQQPKPLPPQDKTEIRHWKLVSAGGEPLPGRW